MGFIYHASCPHGPSFPQGHYGKTKIHNFVLCLLGDSREGLSKQSINIFTYTPTEKQKEDNTPILIKND